ncbi:MAG: hypothetical protein JST26_14940 [Bacteroidetes bacterium]|nr:hypothetical protein [Bacteroidota bacterium]
MKKYTWIALFLVTVSIASAGNNGTNPNPKPKPKQQPSNCIKQPEIVKKSTTAKPETKPAERKVTIAKGQELNTNTIPHFSIFNFFNSFYTKDTLDRLQVM